MRVSCCGAAGSTWCSTVGATATGAIAGSGSVAGSGGGAVGNADCCQWIDAASVDGARLRSTVRSQYQNTNAAIDRSTTISIRTTGTSSPPGRVNCLANSRFSMVRGTTNRSFLAVAVAVAVAGKRVGANADIGIGIGIGIGIDTGCAILGTLATLGGGPSWKGPAETFAAVRIPENLPAHPRQYFARSLFAVWQDSQNFVMAVTTWPGAQGIGMDAVMTTSTLITTEKAAKSMTDARSGMPRPCHGNTFCRRVPVPVAA